MDIIELFCKKKRFCDFVFFEMLCLYSNSSCLARCIIQRNNNFYSDIFAWNCQNHWSIVLFRSLFETCRIYLFCTYLILYLLLSLLWLVNLALLIVETPSILNDEKKPSCFSWLKESRWFDQEFHCWTHAAAQDPWCCEDVIIVDQLAIKLYTECQEIADAS